MKYDEDDGYISEVSKYSMDSALGIVNIYGHIADKSELVLGVGSYNNIHGLLTYFPTEDLLQMRSLPDILTPSVTELILTYEKPLSVNKTERVYFTLAVKSTNKYINVKIELDGDKKVACACISPEKAFFWIDYSSIDKTPRSRLLAGALYSLQTTFGEQDYIVSWKIQGFFNGDLIIFLPTTWYEHADNRQSGFCHAKTGIITLVEKLNQLSFKGYTTQQWCEDVSYISHCTDTKQCGNCLGHCHDPSHICFLNPGSSIVPGENFVCGLPSNEPKLNQSTLVSFTDTPPQTTGTAATWIALISIFIIVALLTWGLSRHYNLN